MKTNDMYPLQFQSIFKERLWGGNKLYNLKGLPAGEENVGESWELSAVPGALSVVSAGPLKGRSLPELIETYRGGLVGEGIYEKFGTDFPLLIKLIDAREDLSIQVHPDDCLAWERHRCPGKTEMWYVMDAEPDACLYVGFNREVSKEEYLDAVEKGSLPALLKKEQVKPGDAFFIPAGTIHAIGGGCLIAEIQQTSDITYRVDDWGRTDQNGNPRQLHTGQALDAIDFSSAKDLNVTKLPTTGQPVQLVSNLYFTTRIIRIAGSYKEKHSGPDVCRIYICTEGNIRIGPVSLKQGDTVLIPATESLVVLQGDGIVLEVVPGEG